MTVRAGASSIGNLNKREQPMRSGMTVWVSLMCLGGLACCSSGGGYYSGGGNGGNGGSAKCMLACQPPASGPCSMNDPTACVDACTTLTAGLSSACTQCIVEHSGWCWLECTCQGGKCTKVGDCTYPVGEPAYPPGCDPVADTKCEASYTLARSTGSACKAACGM